MNDFPRTAVIVANSDTNIYRFRAPIIRKLLEMGVSVYAVAPPGKFVTNIERLGATFVPWQLDRRSLNPLSEVRHVIALMGIYRRLKPDMVHHFTVKPNVYGVVAARLIGIPMVFSGVTGLGYAFSPGGLRRRVLRSWVVLLYHMVAHLSDALTFQTQHDIDVLLGTRRSAMSKALVLKGGAGVDLSKFSPDSVSSHEQEMVRAELGLEPGMLVVTMVSRLLYDKGIAEYVAAAHLVRSRQPHTRFLLAGDPDYGNPGSVTGSDLAAWTSNGNNGSVRHIGDRDDIPAILAVSDVIVHPTYYAEGIPRVLIEAAAMSKPVVTTTIPGVAEITEAGVSGVTVPPRDVGRLAAAIESLLADTNVRRRYGTAGRRKVEAEYNACAVADRYIAAYRRMWAYAGDRRRQASVETHTG